jgi:hypothetical protein
MTVGFPYSRMNGIPEVDHFAEFRKLLQLLEAGT